MKKSLVWALLIMGFTGTAAQVILIRELLIAFYGNELFIGIILGNWLIMEAAGSFILSRIGSNNKKSVDTYVLLQISIAVCLPIVVYYTRLIKGMVGISPGEMVGLFPALFISLLLIAPLSLAHGAHFTIGCHLYSILTQKTTAAVTRVYIYEAIGVVLGGIILSFLVIPYFHSINIALAASALNLISAILLLVFLKNPYSMSPSVKLNWRSTSQIKSTALFLTGSMILTLTGYLLLGSWGDHIQRFSAQTQWQGYDLKFYRNSNYGNIAVTKSDDEYTFYSDGIPITTTPYPDETYIEELAHLTILFHENPKKVLIIGGGFGGLINEVLKHPVEMIDYVELDPMIIETASQFPTTLSEFELNNPRVNVHFCDGRRYIRQTQGNYDIIIINLPPPSTLQLNRFYTLEFFTQAKRVLDLGGIFALTCPGSESFLSEELANFNACIYATLQDTFSYIRVIPGASNLFLASPDIVLITTEAAELNQRLQDRALQTKLLSDFHIRYKLNREKEDWFFASLDKVPDAGINHDLKPVGLFYYLLLWSTLAEQQFSSILRVVRQARLEFFLMLPLFLLAVFATFRKKYPSLDKTSVTISIITTGFAGMTFNLVLILMFQSLYGSVFQMIALLTSLFMVGLVVGSLTMNQMLNHIINCKSLLIKMETLITGYALIIPAIILLFNSYSDYPVIFIGGQVLIFILTLISGTLVGAEFPLANRIYISGTAQISNIAGGLYAGDLLGAWFGATATSIFLIPVLGIVNTCIIVSSIKAASLILVATSKFKLLP